MCETHNKKGIECHRLCCCLVDGIYDELNKMNDMEIKWQ